jgi:translation initiation factor IF-2
MSQGPTKLFKAAKEYNVSTSSIVETLESKGFSIDNKPSVTVTVEMLQALDEVYGIDKRKSQEFEKQREDYHELRNTFKSRQNQSSFLPVPAAIPASRDVLLPRAASL